MSSTALQPKILGRVALTNPSVSAQVFIKPSISITSTIEGKIVTLLFPQGGPGLGTSASTSRRLVTKMATSQIVEY